MRINVQQQRTEILARRRHCQQEQPPQQPNDGLPPGERPPLPLMFARSGFATLDEAAAYAQGWTQFSSSVVFDRVRQCFAVVPRGFWQASHGRNLYGILASLPRVQVQTDHDTSDNQDRPF